MGSHQLYPNAYYVHRHDIFTCLRQSRYRLHDCMVHYRHRRIRHHICHQLLNTFLPGCQICQIGQTSCKCRILLHE